MPKYVVNSLYMGKFPFFDTMETNYTNEKLTVEGWKPGRVFTKNDLQLLSITQNDVVRENRSDRLEEDDRGPKSHNKLGADSITYDIGNGNVTSTIDSVFNWYTTVTRADGTTFETRIHFAQLQDGNVFTTVGRMLNDVKIVSIRLDNLGGHNYFGSQNNRSIQNSSLVSCYAEGTHILTPKGKITIEALSVGDMVSTYGGKVRPIRWIGERHLDSIDLKTHPNLCPIRIMAGTLAPGIPSADLIVSPQHRILIRNTIVQRMFGQSEVLLAAKQLLELDGCEIADDMTQVRYLHILFDNHEVVWANGAPAETLYLGDQMMKAMNHAQKQEVQTLFPDLFPDDGHTIQKHPAPIKLVSGRLARKLTHRSKINSKSLYS